MSVFRPSQRGADKPIAVGRKPLSGSDDVQTFHPLAVCRAAKWENKTLIATPFEWAHTRAVGNARAYNGYGPPCYEDYIADVNAGHSFWKVNGQGFKKPIFQYGTNNTGLYLAAAGASPLSGYAEMGECVALMHFDLRQVLLSHLSSFSIKWRLQIPSAIFCDGYSLMMIPPNYTANYNLTYGYPSLVIRLFPDDAEPTNAKGLETSGEGSPSSSYTLTNVNNGFSQMDYYNTNSAPFNPDNAYGGNHTEDELLRVYTRDNDARYSCDVSFSEAHRAFVKANGGRFWAMAGFARGSSFSSVYPFNSADGNPCGMLRFIEQISIVITANAPILT